MKSIKLLLPLLFLGNTLLLSAQKITGTVTEAATGKPLSEAKVVVKTVPQGKLIGGDYTDKDGRFVLPVSETEGKVTVTASFLGLKEESVTIELSKDIRPLAFSLSEEAKLLNELVVQGLSPGERVLRLAYNVSMVETDKLKTTTMDLSSVLDKVSGVKIRTSGGVGSDANVTLNGFSGRHVKVFIDGIPMDGTSSAFSLSNIPAGLAKRVEVYKGVVPIELGGDALGGAINIITDDSRRTRVEASYSLGSFNTHKSNVYAEWTSPKGLYLSFNAYQNYSDNDYLVDIDHYTKFGDTGNTVVYENLRVPRFHAMYHNETTILQIGVVDRSWADRLIFGFTGGYEYKETQNASNMNWVYGARYTTANTLMPKVQYEKKWDILEGFRLRLGGRYNFGGSFSADTASVNYNWLGERSRPKIAPGELSYSKLRYRDRNGAGNLSAILFPGAGHSLSLSSTFSSFNRSGKDELQPKAVYDHPQVSYKLVSGLSYKYDHRGIWNSSLFVKHYLNHLEAYLDPTGGNNPTEWTNTQSYWGGGLASTYFLGKNWQLRLSYEYALRLPTSRELFGTGDDIERGNATLKPEASNNLNLSVSATLLDYRKHRLTADLALQYRDIKDYIRRTTNNDNGRATSKNDGSVRNLGTDFSFRYTYGDLLYLGGNISYIDMRSLTKYVTGTERLSNNYLQRVPAIPFLYGNADAGITLHDLAGKGITLDLRYMMSYIQKFSYEWNAYQNPELDVPTQFAHDFYVSCNFGKRREFTLSAECTNLFDARLYDNFRMQKPGRAFAIKFAYRFWK